jgi:uncharacterized protein (TIGR02145 family)
VQITLLAQAPPQGINYQAMVYVPYGNQQVGVNSAGQIPANNAEVNVTFAIENGVNGPLVYEETLLKNTDTYGLLTAVIGTGNPTNSNPQAFNQINWGQIDAYLRVTIVLTRYNREVGSYQKLWSVPYAFYTAQANSSTYADTSRFATVAGNGITGVTDNGNGTLTFNYYDGSTYTTGQLSGLTGPQGPAGATGPQGNTGTNGLSAYQIWLQQGNTGTQTDFLNSITGPQGPQGPQGNTGATGAQGPIGLTGPQGPQGNTGATGSQGPQGPIGPQGSTGPQGPAGNGFNNGTLSNQIMYWNGTSWTMLNPGVSGQVLAICNNNLTWVTVNGVCSGSILSLSCASSSNTGTLTSGTATSGVSSSVPYTGGNGGTHNGQTITSTGVTGLTATLVSGNFATGTGSLVYSITGTPNINGTASFALNIGGQSCTLSLAVSLPVGTISSLSCGTATNSGTLTSGTAASGVSSSIPYTGGNGGTHNGQIVTSTGVTGLTATLISGNFATGTGSLVYTITGTPNTNGTASFALNIGGQACVLTRTVSVNLVAQYPSGSVFCASGPTAIVEVTNPTTGKVWMDRNLGASQVATSSTDANSYGDLYQWGRRNDGHQCRTSATTTTLSSVDQPTNGNFILVSAAPNDWRIPQNTNLWQGVNGINNPCPTGFRLPSEFEIESERLSWGGNNSNGAFLSPLKLPNSGNRNYTTNGIITGVGNSGSYWSSSIIGTSSRHLGFSSSIAAVSTSDRANGFSVRCVKN